METQKIISRNCRLCLKICESFEALEGIMKNFLDKLLPKINLAAVQKPVVCTNCAELLKKCFDFKTMCLNTHGNIISLANNKDAAKLGHIDMLSRRNENGTGIQKDRDICGLCRSPPENCSAVSLDIEEGDVILDKMMEQCFPELDLSINKKPVICTPCYGSLEIYFHFVTNCLAVEEKINKYCETLDITSRSQIELSQLLQFSIRYVTTEADEYSVGVIKVEEELCKEREYAENNEIGKECAIKSERKSCDSSEAVKVEVETERYMDITDLKFNDVEQFTPRNMLACEEESDRFGVIKTEETFCGKDVIKEENVVEMEDQKFLLNEEIEIKTDNSDFYRFEDDVVSPHPEVATRLLMSRKCLMSNLEGNLLESNIKHTLTRTHVSKIRMHQCDCCSYQTKYKQCLKRHLLVHKDPSEVTMYKCDSCSFQTEYNKNLKKHLLVHRDPSEVTVYKCDFCSYQTKFKYNFRKHQLVHNDLSEVTMYKCDSCSFLTKRKGSLKTHLLKHMNPSEVTKYKCDSCSYQTKYKGHLKKHSLIHRNPSEVTTYKCDSCSYQTKYQVYLKSHMLVHRNSSEVIKYNCDSCSFQTKYSVDLKIHSLVHKDPSKLVKYKCEPSEVTAHKCDSCSFQTKDKGNLKQHLLVHKNPSEVAMFKCASCSFQSKRKGDLKQHLLRHKDPLEVKMYQCDFCSYQTKRKTNLKRHILLVHKENPYKSLEITT